MEITHWVCNDIQNDMVSKLVIAKCWIYFVLIFMDYYGWYQWLLCYNMRIFMRLFQISGQMTMQLIQEMIVVYVHQWNIYQWSHTTWDHIIFILLLSKINNNYIKINEINAIYLSFNFMGNGIQNEDTKQHENNWRIILFVNCVQCLSVFVILIDVHWK